MRAKWVIPLALLFAVSSWAAELSFSGSLGMDFRFQPPLTIQTSLNMRVDVGKAGMESRTILSLSGLEAEKLWLWLNFDGITLRSGLTFDPCFSLWTLEGRGCCCGPCCCPFFFGGMFLLGNLAPACQTPNYTVGFILDLGFGGTPGFLARSLTGFGVTNLYALIDGDPWTEVVLVPGWWFEEELLHFAYVAPPLSAYTTWLFTWAGLSFGELGVSYTFGPPEVEIGAGFRLDASLALAWAKLWLSVTIDPVTVRSTTAFDFFGFLWQEIALEIRFSRVFLYSRTLFDLSGLQELRVGFELAF